MRAMIEDTAERIFRDRCSKDLIDRAEQGVWPAELWQTLEEAGLPLAAVPAEFGGSAGALGDAMAVLRLAGHHAAPLPLAETFLAGWALAGSGQTVPAGPLSVAPVRASDRLRLSRQGGRTVLEGSAGRVPWAREAACLVVLAETDAGATMLAQVDPDACTITPGSNLAGEPRAQVIFEGVAPTELAPAGTEIDTDALWLMGALARAVQMAGALDSALEMTVRYALERKQFGREIAKFQAIQQQIAVMAGHVAAAGKAADTAVAAAENEGDATVAIAVAKARIGEAAGIGSEIAHQVHGAMGFTHEHPLHQRTRRLWSWRDEFGAEAVWQAELGRRIARGGADNLWRFITRT